MNRIVLGTSALGSTVPQSVALKILEAAYNLPIEDRVELKNLLENNIADSRRDEIYQNYKTSLVANKKGKLKFSDDIKKLKKMI